jgi:hypothetical protein
MPSGGQEIPHIFYGSINLTTTFKSARQLFFPSGTAIQPPCLGEEISNCSLSVTISHNRRPANGVFPLSIGSVTGRICDKSL